MGDEPISNFKWRTYKQISKLVVDNFQHDSNNGLILVVDLEYSPDLHDLHSDYPLDAEKIKVTENMLSDYAKEIQQKFNLFVGDVYKLIPTLSKQETYVLHYRNPQLYLHPGRPRGR